MAYFYYSLRMHLNWIVHLILRVLTSEEKTKISLLATELFYSLVIFDGIWRPWNVKTEYCAQTRCRVIWYVAVCTKRKLKQNIVLKQDGVFLLCLRMHLNWIVHLILRVLTSEEKTRYPYWRQQLFYSLVIFDGIWRPWNVKTEYCAQTRWCRSICCCMYKKKVKTEHCAQTRWRIFIVSLNVCHFRSLEYCAQTRWRWQ